MAKTKPPPKESLTIRLGTTATEVDATAVASTMQAIAAIIEESQVQLNANEQVLLKARPFAKGSFEIPLDLIYVGVLSLYENHPLLMQILAVLKEYLSIRQLLKGKSLPPPEKDGTFVVNGSQITIQNSVIQIISNNQVIRHELPSDRLALARSKMTPQLREKADPEDVAQSVFKSFFARQSQGQIELINWDSLWGLLALFTVRKCARRAEHFQAGRRNMRRDISTSTATDDSTGGWQIASSEPTAEQAAILSETVAQLMAGLDEREQEMLALCLQGYTPEEVGVSISCSGRTVRRLLQRVRDQLGEMNSSVT